MKREQLRKKLKATAKRRAKREAASAHSAAASGSLPSNSSDSNRSDDRQIEGVLVESLLEIHQSGELDDSSIIAGLRAWLKFTSPSRQSALLVHDCVAQMERDSDFSTRDVRSAAARLVERALDYQDDRHDRSAFLNYLQVMAS